MTHFSPSRFLFLTLLFSTFITLAFGQPTNDDCSTATPLILAASTDTCIPILGDTRGTVDATLVEGPEVCSGSWYTDDVWYSLETGNIAPEHGITIEVRLDPDNNTELVEHGMALYFFDCNTTSEPIDCFSDEPGRRTISFFSACTEPNTKYLVRLWSAPDPTTNAGTFSICAYETPLDPTVNNEPQARVIYEEYFDTGFNGWTSVPITETYCSTAQELVPTEWIWSNTGCVPNAFGAFECLERPQDICQESGVVGFPSGWYVSEKSSYGFSGIPPYPIMEAYLVSPSIDLTNESCINLSWIESHRGLNGSDISRFGPIVEYSIDGGATWSPPSPRINSRDVSINYGGEYVVNNGKTNLKRTIPLYGAEGNPDVKIRFGFKGDFYHWIIDDVKIIEATTYNLTSSEDLISKSTINPMSIYQIDTIRFYSNVTNSGCEDQNNIEINVAGVNTSENEIPNESQSFNTLIADQRIGNQYLDASFVPDPEVDTYTFSYTTSSNEDNDPTDDTASFEVDLVDEMVFRKENGEVTDAVSPFNNEIDYSYNQTFNWEIGNIFFAPNANLPDGRTLKFNTISFRLNDYSAFNNDTLQICLYKIKDQNLDSLITKDDTSEITLLGKTQYVLSGEENNMITIAIAPHMGDEINLHIEAGTNYMASIQSNFGIGTLPMALASNNQIDYSLTNSIARENANGNHTKMRYTYAYSVRDQESFRLIPVPQIGYDENILDGKKVPLIRLGYEAIDELTIPQTDNEFSLSLSPNPVHSNLSISATCEKNMDMKVNILSLDGQILTSKNYTEISTLNESFDVSDFANGVYMIHIRTQDGILTKKFVVNK